MSCLTSISFDIALLYSVRQWLESLEVRDPKIARLLCKIIPTDCLFNRETKLFTHSVPVQVEPSLRASGWF